MRPNILLCILYLYLTIRMVRIITSSQLPKDKKICLVTLTANNETVVQLLKTGQKNLCIGIGPDRKKITRRKLISLARKMVRLAKSHRLERLTVETHNLIFPHLKMLPMDLAEVLATNWELANFDFNQYKTPPKEGFPNVEEITLTGDGLSEWKKGLEKGSMTGDYINRCRVLCNIPGGEMTPDRMAKDTIKVVAKSKVKVHIMGQKEIEKNKMGALLGVARGSVEEPRFIVMEYRGGGKEKPIVLVGKGITFDSGGLNIKPGDHMHSMHMDMTGGAVVIHTVALAAKLGLKCNVVGLVAAAENMPSGNSYRPGDILTSMSGTTIEVMNTDAEGRLVLADALTYAKKYQPRLVVDVATLTGAALVAVGMRASVIMTKDEKLQNLFMELGEKSGDYVWPLPLWEEFEDEIKGTFSDIINTGKTRWAGTVHGGMFLYQFAKEYPWIHMDIAPRMTSTEGDYLGKGATGEPMRLLIKLLEEYK